jgi:DNA mismatch endonuclease (patch repair protein)
MDVVSSVKRSEMMSGIKGRNTRPEMQVRAYLHAHGLRFRLHRKDLPGRPDVVLPKYRVAVFVHGCFWHRHAGCKYTTNPSTREEFWKQKFAANAERDLRNQEALLQAGWRVLVIWECGLRSKSDLDPALQWINGGQDGMLTWPLKTTPAQAS